MGIAVGQAAPTIEVAADHQLQDQARSGLRYLGRNRQLVFGLSLLGLLALFVILGHIFYDVNKYRPLSVPAGRAPVGRVSRSGPIARAAISWRS